MTAGIHNYPDASCHGYPVDPGNVGVRLVSSYADAGRRRLARDSRIADVDVKVSSGQVISRHSANRDIVRSSGVAVEGRTTDRNVIKTGGVLVQRHVAIGCVKTRSVVL